MVGTDKDLMERINREQVKVGGGLHFLGGKKKGFLRGVTERKRNRVVHERRF